MGGTPPDKGSFPLDHDSECSMLKADYLKCLKESSYDNMACRYLSKQYLECRMDKNLMAREPITNLGFTDDDNTAKPVWTSKKKQKEDTGWTVGIDCVKPCEQRAWRIPRLIKLPSFGFGGSSGGS